MQDNSKPIKAVFFDLGYTLVYFSGDFYKVILESYLVLADELIKNGCQIDRIEFACDFSQKMKNYYQQREQDFLERPIEQIVKEIIKEHHQEPLSDDVYMQAMQAMYLVTERNWLLEEDTHETLQCLLDQNYQLGLISNASNAWDVNNLIDNHHLRNYFSTILISATEGIRKPNPKIFRVAADQLHIKLSEAVMVGDTLEADILGAHNAGMRGIWISRRKERPSPQEKLDPKYLPDAEIHTLKELPALLTTWNQ
jgi:HAD superfamily hydrolase (TIGR01662 family)